jgi:hypothetical protein
MSTDTAFALGLLALLGRHAYKPRVRAVRTSRSAATIVRMIPFRHDADIEFTERPGSVNGCQDCLAAIKPWCHLRICLESGHGGCCDSSPDRHAATHADITGHPVNRSLEPHEEWSWCYIDQVGMLIPEVAGTADIPPSPLEP